MKQLVKNKPDFCTFFTNHVASSMHRYWAALFPDDYTSFNHTSKWVQTYHDEIMFTMSKFDEMLRRLIAFMDGNKDFELWIATSMGQAATSAEPCECELWVVDDAKFARFFGLQNWERRPAMVPDLGLLVSTEQESEFEAKLKGLRIDDESIQFKKTGNFFSITLGQVNQKGKCATYQGNPVAFDELGLENQIIEDLTGATAYHIPAGCLLIYGRGPAKTSTIPISTTDVHVAIMANYGLATGSEL